MKPGFIAGVLLLLLTGCAQVEPSQLTVTVPNGRSPAKDHAPHAPMNDTDAMRSDWNHGNGVLWVSLPVNGVLTPTTGEKDGTLQVKFGWWRGVPGRLTITGHRLDASAPPLRGPVNDDGHGYGEFGFLASYLDFPTEGYWEVTGTLNNQSLTFVVRVVKSAGL